MLLIVGRLVGPAEIRAMFAVGKTQARNLTLEEDFPEPYDRLAAGTVWLRDEVREWGLRHGRTIYGEDTGTEAP